MLKISGITKNFGKLTVLDGISLEIRPGRAAVVTGANGVGKTTLLKIAAGILVPDAGEVFWRQGDALSDARAFRQASGFASSDEKSFYGHLSALENLAFFSGLYGKTRGALFENSAGKLGASALWGRRFDFLSKGTKQKLSFLRALLGPPEIIIADELDSLDAASREAADAIIGEFLAQGGTVLCVRKSPAPFPCDNFILSGGGIGRC